LLCGVLRFSNNNNNNNKKAATAFKMAPRRPTKRSKVTDSHSSSVSSPVVVASAAVVSPSQAEDSAPVINNNNNTTPPVLSNSSMKEILLSLATSKTQAQAIKAMTMLDDSMETGTNAQQVFDLQGVSTIVYGILRYATSEMMLQHGLGALVDMTYALSTDKRLYVLLDKVGEALQRLDFLEKIPSLVSIHDTYLVSSHAARLLGNLMSLDTKTREYLVQLGSEEIVKFMVTTMAAYADVVCVIDAACVYFDKISRFPEVKERFLKQGVFARMAAAFQLFSNFDGALEFDEEDIPRVKSIIKYSQQVMGRLMEI
jgi:hypothetical protein